MRLEVVQPLAGVPAPLWNPAERSVLAGVLAEYRAAQQISADQPEGQLNLGNVQAHLGEPEAALSRYDQAIRLAPHAIPAYVNRADLLRTRGREGEAEASLRDALARAPGSADVHYALGLSLVRQKRMPEAVSALARATALAPERSRYAVAYVLALRAVGEDARAARVLAEARARRPGDPEIAALASPEGEGVP